MQKLNKVAVFDLDGTLYSIKSIDSANIVAATVSISQYLKIPKIEAQALLKNKREIPNSEHKNAISKVLELIGVPLGIIEKNQNIYIKPENHIKRDDELVLLIRELKNKFKIALLTNTRMIIAEKILISLGFSLNDFDLIMTGDKLIKAKPSTFEIKKCVNILSGDIKESIMIGDRWNIDLEPAFQIGMKTALIKNREDLINFIKTEIKKNS